MCNFSKDRICLFTRLTIGRVKPISGPLTAPRVEALQKLPLASLAVWGIRFPEETEVVFNARRTSENLDATILGEDRVLLQVGQPLQSVSNPLPSVRAQRKLFTCPFCRTTRTFTEESKLKQHMSSDHWSLIDCSVWLLMRQQNNKNIKVIVWNLLGGNYLVTTWQCICDAVFCLRTPHSSSRWWSPPAVRFSQSKVVCKYSCRNYLEDEYSKHPGWSTFLSDCNSILLQLDLSHVCILHLLPLVVVFVSVIHHICEM